MSVARLEVETGSFRFAAEGSEAWVEAQWSKLKERAFSGSSSINVQDQSAPSQKDHAAKSSSAPVLKKALATFLKEKAVGTSQVKRFLATAIWLGSTGKNELKTSDVSKALVDAHQKKLGNPADVLNQNVAKGFCVKNGDGFYVTPEGEASLP